MDYYEVTTQGDIMNVKNLNANILRNTAPPAGWKVHGKQWRRKGAYVEVTEFGHAEITLVKEGFGIRPDWLDCLPTVESAVSLADAILDGRVVIGPEEYEGQFEEQVLKAIADGHVTVK